MSAISAISADDTAARAPARLSTPDRFLPAWIGLAMAIGLVLGRLLPDLDDWLDG